MMLLILAVLSALFGLACFASLCVVAAQAVKVKAAADLEITRLQAELAKVPGTKDGFDYDRLAEALWGARNMSMTKGTMSSFCSEPTEESESLHQRALMGMVTGPPGATTAEGCVHRTCIRCGREWLLDRRYAWPDDQPFVCLGRKETQADWDAAVRAILGVTT